MYLWVDDLRDPPKDGNDWLWARSVREAETAIMLYERQSSQALFTLTLTTMRESMLLTVETILRF